LRPPTAILESFSNRVGQADHNLRANSSKSPDLRLQCPDLPRRISDSHVLTIPFAPRPEVCAKLNDLLIVISLHLFRRKQCDSIMALLTRYKEWFWTM
jgi:hypothetical protein